MGLLEKVGLLYELDRRKWDCCMSWTGERLFRCILWCKGIEGLFRQEKLRKFWELLKLVLQV